MNRLLGALDAVSRATAYVAAGLIAGIAALILVEVTGRFLFNVSFSFAWEYSAYFMACAMFAGAAFTLRTGGHVRVSLLTINVPGWLARIFDLVATVVALVLATYIAWALTSFAWSSFATGRTSSTIDRTPLVYPQGAMAFGAILLALQLAARLVRLLTGRPPEDMEAKRVFGVE